MRMIDMHNDDRDWGKESGENNNINEWWPIIEWWKWNFDWGMKESQNRISIGEWKGKWIFNNQFTPNIPRSLRDQDKEIIYSLIIPPRWYWLTIYWWELYFGEWYSQCRWSIEIIWINWLRIWIIIGTTIWITIRWSEYRWSIIGRWIEDQINKYQWDWPM